MDHIKPRCKGGATSWDNLVAACLSCNSKKANKELSQLGPQFKLRRQPTRPSTENVKLPGNRLLKKRVGEQPWEGYLQQMA